MTSAIGAAGGVVGAVDVVEMDGTSSLRDIVVDAWSREHWRHIIEAIDAIPGAETIDTTDRTFQLHLGGKIEQLNRHPLKTRDDLSMVYTPGVARVCLAIEEDEDRAFQYTIKRNTVAVVSDGSAVLGTRRHRPAGGDARDGGQVLFVQGVRRGRRVSDLPGRPRTPRRSCAR